MPHVLNPVILTAMLAIATHAPSLDFLQPVLQHKTDMDHPYS